MSLLGDIAKAVIPSVVGGFFADESAEDRRNADVALAREQAERNEQLQREFAQQGIRWRVEDAKAAGLHPVFAIGGAGAAYAPNPIVLPAGSDAGATWRDMGQNVSRALLAQQTAAQAKAADAQLRLLEAQATKEYAQAAYYQSEAARGAQAAGQSAPFPNVGPEFVGPPDLRQFYDSRVGKPAEQVAARSDNPHVTAAQGAPGLMEVEIGKGGFRMLVPQSQDLAESLEAMGESPLLSAMVLEENSKHYGPGWYRELGKRLPGLSQLIGLGEDIGEALPIWSRVMERMKREGAKFDEHGHRSSGWLDSVRERWKGLRSRTTRKWPY